jgi:hypothetical protein
MNDADVARRVRELAERVRLLPPVWTHAEQFFRDRHELSRALRRLADEIAPGTGADRQERGRRVTEVRHINGRKVTVQRQRAGFTIYVNG